jgi:hypothetical protein
MTPDLGPLRRLVEAVVRVQALVVGSAGCPIPEKACGCDSTEDCPIGALLDDLAPTLAALSERPGKGRIAELIEPDMYALARDMARRGFFVRDDMGAPSIHAIREIVAGAATAIASALRGGDATSTPETAQAADSSIPEERASKTGGPSDAGVARLPTPPRPAPTGGAVEALPEPMILKIAEAMADNTPGTYGNLLSAAQAHRAQAVCEIVRAALTAAQAAQREAEGEWKEWETRARAMLDELLVETEFDLVARPESSAIMWGRALEKVRVFRDFGRAIALTCRDAENARAAERQRADAAEARGERWRAALADLVTFYQDLHNRRYEHSGTMNATVLAEGNASRLLIKRVTAALAEPQP